MPFRMAVPLARTKGAYSVSGYHASIDDIIHLMIVTISSIYLLGTPVMETYIWLSPNE